MSEDSGTYNLFLSPERSNVGIWYFNLNRNPTGQPVRLDADLVEWVATPPISDGGPTRLGAGPYQYTGVFKGEVFATNERRLSQEWFLIARNDEDAYLIATDLTGDRVWSAQEPGAPIKITNFTGKPNQLFKFVSVENSGMRTHFTGVRSIS